MKIRSPFEFCEDENENYPVKRYFSEISKAWAENYSLYGGFQIDYHPQEIRIEKTPCFRLSLIECYYITINRTFPDPEELASFLVRKNVSLALSEHLIEFGIKYPNEIEDRSPILAFGEFVLKIGSIHGDTQIWVDYLKWGSYYRNSGNYTKDSTNLATESYLRGPVTKRNCRILAIID